MAEPSRYFCPSIAGDEAVLSGAEAHHLIHVMRGGVGARAVLFDGTGWEYSAQVAQLGRTEAKLVILDRRQVDRELPFPVILAVSLPKGDRQKWLVEKAVELGVAQLVPLKAARSVAQPVQQALARLRRTVIEASKQCGRNRLLEITEPQEWADFALAAPREAERILAHPASRAKTARDVLSRPSGEAGPPRPVYLAVGPEGGFTPEEVALAAAAGWQPIELGPRILRVETAALLLVALACWDRQA
ncbi:MAG: RsmE family RNA methyltransferase [Thermoguttaceae bacterium]